MFGPEHTFTLINADFPGTSQMEGTSLQGYIDISFDELLEFLGPPLGPSADGKVDVEWGIAFHDGLVATFYNYKDGPSYLGPDTPPVDTINNWHIGGKGPEVIKRITNLFPEHAVRLSR